MKEEPNNLPFYLLNKEFALRQFANESLFRQPCCFLIKLKKMNGVFFPLLELYLNIHLKTEFRVTFRSSFFRENELFC